MAVIRKHIWRIFIYDTNRQCVELTSTYILKIVEDLDTAAIEKKIRKDFKKDLKKKSTFFDYTKVR